MTMLFLTNADTEILALRSVLEGLPDDFPAVRAANPTAVEAPDLDGVEVVLVRLLGGRDAWRAPFDELRRMDDLLWRLTERSGVTISALPVSVTSLDDPRSPTLIRAKAEAIVVA